MKQLLLICLEKVLLLTDIEIKHRRCAEKVAKRGASAKRLER